jgi:hypothetical protein
MLPGCPVEPSKPLASHTYGSSPLSEEGGVMKKLVLSMLLFAGPVISGCSIANTPAYTAQERFSQIGRNWSYEYEQIADDTDHLLLLRPASRLTVWNVYHRN